MTKKQRKGVHVTGRKGEYKIQPWIDHQPWCGCLKCSVLPVSERELPHSFRIKRASIFPDDFGESAKYARQVKAEEELRLAESGTGWMAARPDEITLSQLVCAYNEAHPASERNAEILELHIVPFFGTMPAANLKPADVRRYQRARVATGVSPNTVDREWNALRAVLNFAEAEERIARNPIRRGAVRGIGEGKPKEEFFEPEEWRDFLSAITHELAFCAYLAKQREDGPVRIVNGRAYGSGKRNPASEASKLQFARTAEMRPFFGGLLYGCARAGELIALRWKDVDLRRGIVTLYQQKTRKPKTLPIVEPWRIQLEALPRGLPDVRVYRRLNGAEYEYEDVRRTFHLVLAIAGIKKALTPHSIRHTVLSWLAMAGVSKPHRDEIGGHARPTVGDGYAHLTKDALMPALTTLARIERDGFTNQERAGALS